MLDFRTPLRPQPDSQCTTPTATPGSPSASPPSSPSQAGISTGSSAPRLTFHRAPSSLAILFPKRFGFPYIAFTAQATILSGILLHPASAVPFAAAIAANHFTAVTLHLLNPEVLARDLNGKPSRLPLFVTLLAGVFAALLGAFHKLLAAIAPHPQTPDS